MQLIERIVSEVNGRKRNLPSRDGMPNSGRFFGYIGPNLTYSGNYVGTPECKITKETIWLDLNGQELISIIIKKGVDDFCRERNQMPRTLYEVYTPRCSGEKCMLKENETIKQLRVYHGKDEDVDDFFDNLWDQYAYNKAIESVDRHNKSRNKNLAIRLGESSTPVATVPVKVYRCTIKKHHQEKISDDCEK